MTTAENPVRLRDPAMMRALAHPARLAIMGHLGGGRTATATGCAELVGLSPSATSYHLRALARAGLVREAPGRGDGRERVWMSAIDAYYVADEQTVDPEVREAEDRLVDAFLLLHDARVREFMARRADEDPQWYAVTVFRESHLELTAAELGELQRKIQNLLDPYRQGARGERPEGTRTVIASFRAFPLPGQDVKL